MRTLTMIFLFGLLFSFTCSIKNTKRKEDLTDTHKLYSCNMECSRRESTCRRNARGDNIRDCSVVAWPQCKFNCLIAYGGGKVEHKEKILCEYKCQGRRSDCVKNCSYQPVCTQKCNGATYDSCTKECNVNIKAA